MTESASADAVVPQAFADRAMASIMYLHRELAMEKDRAGWLYRTLLEREQALAELWAYVHALEAQAGLAPPPTTAAFSAPPADLEVVPPPVEESLEVVAGLAEAAADALEREAERVEAAPPSPPPAPPKAAPPPRADGWKVW